MAARRGTGLLVVLLIAVLAAGGGLMATIVSGGGQALRAGLPGTATGAPTSSPSSSDSPATSLPLAEAQDGKQVRVVESGWTPYRQRTSHRMTWGVVVENASQQTAALVRAAIDLVDPEGRSLLSNGPESRWFVVMPGTRAGIGGFPYLTGPPDGADLVVTLEEEWWPPGTPQYHPVAATQVSDIDPSRDDPRELRGYPLAFTFRVDSEYDIMLEQPYIDLVFRDRTGAIVGGLEEKLLARIPPGWSIHRLRLHDDLPPEVDVAGTEIYVSVSIP